MLNDRKNKKLLKYLLVITFIFTLTGLIINSGARCSIYVGPPNISPNPYPNGGIYPPPTGLNGGYLNPYQTPTDMYFNYSYSPYNTYWQPQYQPYPNFSNWSNWNWPSPTTAYNPNPVSGGGIHLFVSYPEGGAWQSPYYQQIGYNPFSFNHPYNSCGYSYNPFSNQQSYYPYGYQQSYSPYGFQQSYNSYGYQQSYYPFGYQQSYNPWQSWEPADDCSEDGILARKPAIYLYPEEDTEVKVTLDINGVFTETIPPYNSGWEVLATKDGKIFTRDMKEGYDYLFWEAQMNHLALPDKGWVVAQENLKGWFDQNLSKLGLNGKEEADFMEYWLDKLSGSEYYEIKLLDQSFWELDAKLSIDPSPDTVIRVILYFIPLDEYKILESPEIQTPERKGFVALEWGGILGE